ncbi:AAA family ATPase [Candidatus Njordibacter sp. Uisw_002]|uniref:AAA family ATPase n=1 Tax=Candidatus Njordibacter sp. Uisw_002 TaxID=3230971 RepID=UPI003D3FAE6A
MSLENILFADQLVKDDLLMIIDAKIATNVLLHGSNGTGKTMIANQIATDLGLSDCIEFSFDPTNFNVGKLVGTLNIQRMSVNANGLIVIDEIDRLKTEAQYELQNFVDTYCTDTAEKSAICSVILTTNNLTKVIPALTSRCSTYHICGPTPDQLLLTFLSRLTNESVKMSPTAALELLTSALSPHCKQLSYRNVALQFRKTVYAATKRIALW